MTVVLVAVEGWVEGCKGNTSASLVSQEWTGGHKKKREEVRQTSGLFAWNVDLDTNSSLLHSPSHLFSPFVSVLCSSSLLSCSLPFISLCPHSPLCFSFCHPFRSWWLSLRLTQPSRTQMRNCSYCTC